MESPPDSAPPPSPWPARLRLPLFPVRLTYVLIGVNVLVFLPTFFLGTTVYSLAGLVPGRILQDGEWWRLITGGFLHADLAHIGFNMYALYVFGRDVEHIFGSLRFGLVYFLALLGGNAIVTLLTPLDTLTVGASGAILGVLGALVAFYWRYQELVVGGRRQLTNLATTALINLGLGLLPRISLWGHAGGTLVGLAAGLALLPVYRLISGPVPHFQRGSKPEREMVGVALILGACLLILGLAFGLRT
jgi:membrane associated rhomboid family serine protease